MDPLNSVNFEKERPYIYWYVQSSFHYLDILMSVKTINLQLRGFILSNFFFANKVFFPVFGLQRGSATTVILWAIVWL